MTIFKGLALESALESADYNAKSADFSADFVAVGLLPILNMLNIYMPISRPMGDYCYRPTVNRSSGFWPLGSDHEDGTKQISH